MSKEEPIYLDDSWDGLDEKIIKSIIDEIKDLSYEEIVKEAKEEGINIENAESYTKEELLKKIEDKLRDE